MASKYSGFDLSSLPKRVTSTFDAEEANGLLATIQKDGAVTDSTTYETAEAARNAGLRAKRLVDHVVPAGQRTTIRTFALDAKGKPVATDGVAFGWVLSLKAAKAAKNEAAS